jgi:hypothetical protein
MDTAQLPGSASLDQNDHAPTPAGSPTARVPMWRRRRSARRIGLLVVAALVIMSVRAETVDRRSHSRRDRDLAEQLEGSQRKLKDMTAAFTRLATIAAAQAGVGVDAVTGHGLRRLQELPAFGQDVPKRASALLAAATVVVGKRGGPAEPWFRGCTATKATDGASVVVMTAAHCFLDDITRYPDSITTPDLRDVTRLTSQRYAILDPADMGGTAPVWATVRAAFLDISYSDDWALLTVTGASPAFDGLPALDLTPLLHGGRPHAAGQSVQLFSYPSSAVGPVTITGVYAGRAIDVQSGPFRQDVDLVAITPKSAAKDPCYYGGSGSSAVFADGTFTGPTSSRSPLGYGPNHEVADPDSLDPMHRLTLEDAVDVDLGTSTVVCAFTAPRETQILDQLLVMAAAGSSHNAGQR